jgi:hypothetical protein
VSVQSDRPSVEWRRRLAALLAVSRSGGRLEQLDEVP